MQHLYEYDCELYPYYKMNRISNVASNIFMNNFCKFPNQEQCHIQIKFLKAN